MRCSQDGAAGSNPSDHREPSFLRHGGVTDQADAARATPGQLDHAVPRQSTQMILRRIGGTKTKGSSDLGTGGRHPRLQDMTLDEIQDLLLARGQVIAHV